MVRTFRTLASDKGFRRTFGRLQIVSAINYTPKVEDEDYLPKNDVPWLTRYRKRRGRIFISGNTAMPDVPHELHAIEEQGLIGFFLPPKWNNWRFPRKTALIFVWMERIIAQAKVSKPGSLYRVPNDWSEDANLFVIPSTGPLKLKMREYSVSVSKPKKKAKARRTAKVADPLIPDLLTDSDGQLR